MVFCDNFLRPITCSHNQCQRRKGDTAHKPVESGKVIVIICLCDNQTYSHLGNEAGTIELNESIIKCIMNNMHGGWLDVPAGLPVHQRALNDLLITYSYNNRACWCTTECSFQITDYSHSHTTALWLLPKLGMRCTSRCSSSLCECEHPERKRNNRY